MVDLSRQYDAIKQDIQQNWEEVITTTQFINGAATKKFTADLAAYLDARHCIPCANGTDALQIALMALGLQPGDEVISIPFTFVATVEVVALLQLKPVFVDIDPHTFNLDAAQLEKAITPRTKCIIPVHLFGQAADMDAIMAIAEKHQLYVVEDNAQAIGCNYRMKDGSTRKTGTIGHIGTTSFYPTKNLGGYGDGGALFTNDDTLAAKMLTITNHGSDRRYYYDSIGVNSRLDSLQAAILNAKLPHLDQYNRKRQQAADYYDKLLAGIEGIEIPARAATSNHVFHQYTIRVKNRRDALQQFLQEAGIPSMIYYPVPLHLSKAYAEYGYQPGDFPVSEHAATEVLSLPMHTELDADQIEYIAMSISNFMNK
ncbi:MAG: transcriptional regulator [Sphingobacteriales bacterium BACL12 MAG-120802-bin5]|nr:MAG: transcriptional regulator [Sphingobacteriales bacterium BACL12 MAG-120802-bin5]